MFGIKHWPFFFLHFSLGGQPIFFRHTQLHSEVQRLVKLPAERSYASGIVFQSTDDVLTQTPFLSYSSLHPSSSHFIGIGDGGVGVGDVGVGGVGVGLEEQVFASSPHAAIINLK